MAYIEENWETIRAELDALLEHHAALPNFQEISKDQIGINWLSILIIPGFIFGTGVYNWWRRR